MGVPKLAKWYGQFASATVGSISRMMLAADIIDSTKLEDDAVRAEHVLETDDFVMGTLEAVKVTGTTRLVTKQGLHTGVALADLTATFGDPAAIDNGSLFVYKNGTDNKTYLVTVIQSVYQVEELTPVTA